MGHEAWMGVIRKMRGAYRDLAVKLEGKRQLGRPRRRWILKGMSKE
jgi:hypothetical protein